MRQPIGASVKKHVIETHFDTDIATVKAATVPTPVRCVDGPLRYLLQRTALDHV